MIDLSGMTLSDLRDAADKASVVDVEADVARRAMVAFLKSPGAPQAKAVGIASSGKSYVALLGGERIGAVYRVRNDLQLKRLRRVPESVAYLAELVRRKHA
ncbi:hypothetical protein [Caulobacter sp. Root1472]|uniref:hypothetical protein n=1 Tax=Caulobacter sp. Root1472 TaxID=1736470 RepID=UPI0012E3F548|nr:hypothetical protein [Caulobacter sp. Root1472]